MNNDLDVAHPLSGSSSSCFLTELELKKLVFEERGKPEYPVKNFTEKGSGPTMSTNSTHIWLSRWDDLNPGHIGGTQMVSLLRHRPFLCLLPSLPSEILGSELILNLYSPTANNGGMKFNSKC